MVLSNLSLSWESHKKSLCNGLSTLQQNGEFVDMTLAADGYHVKVHQVIMALASPYIKELISSAQCPHPVIFLNKISHQTLTALLEYIYTGEVIVPISNLKELIKASKELHIQGLANMNLDETLKAKMGLEIKPPSEQEKNFGTFVNANDDHEDYDDIAENNYAEQDSNLMKVSILNESKEEHSNTLQTMSVDKITPSSSERKKKPDSSATMQYSVTNQGSLHLILNRFIYYYKFQNRKNVRQWRCINYVRGKCPAVVLTQDGIIVQRRATHNHPFHDHKILQKLHAGNIFTTLDEAEVVYSQKKDKKKKDATEEAPDVSSIS